MKWKNEAVESLREYNSYLVALDNLREQINVLENDSLSLKGSLTNSEPVSGGMSRQEDKLLDNLAKKMWLSKQLSVTIKKVQTINTAFLTLNEKEKSFLNIFYMNRHKDYIDRLSEEYCCEVAEVYRIKDEYLKKFATVLFGVID